MENEPDWLLTLSTLTKDNTCGIMLSPGDTRKLADAYLELTKQQLTKQLGAVSMERDSLLYDKGELKAQIGILKAQLETAREGLEKIRAMKPSGKAGFFRYEYPNRADCGVIAMEALDKINNMEKV